MKRAIVATLMAAGILVGGTALPAAADPIIQLKLSGNCKQHINVLDLEEDLGVHVLQVCFQGP